MNSSLNSAVLTVSETRVADKLTIESGTTGFQLLQQAGRAVYDAIINNLSAQARLLVVGGTGTHAGDGLIAAAHLGENGYDVTIVVVGDSQSIRGDARRALDALPHPLLDWRDISVTDYSFIVDAILGAGLDRPVTGVFLDCIDTINESNANVISIDLPSGVNGDTGQVLGTAIEATQTITFFRKKPGHLLFPGRHLCGTTTVVQIGIDASVLPTLAPSHFENNLSLWHDQLAMPIWETHKYKRGHALVLSGGPTSGSAARLAARAALRVGAGLVSLIGNEETSLINAAHTTTEMIKVVNTIEDLHELLQDKRFTSLTLGPGLGIGEATRDWVKTALSTTVNLVLDADALTSFQDCPDKLFECINESSANVVMTPHYGEFSRLFTIGNREMLSKTNAASIAAKMSSSVVVFKGPDSVIAHPNGKTVINTNAPPWLATAGTGDVLAGTIGGCIAQGVNTFDAACAACWIHSNAAERAGIGMIASDLETHYPAVLETLYRTDASHVLR